MREKNRKYLIRGPLALVLVGILMILIASAINFFYHYIMPSHDKDLVFQIFKIGFYLALTPIILFQFLYPSNILAKADIRPRFSILMILFLYLIFFPVVDYLFIIVLNTDMLFTPLYGVNDAVYFGTAKYHQVVEVLTGITFVFYLLILLVSLIIRIFVKDKESHHKKRHHHHRHLDEDDD
ncbi:MAG: hypothetical protein PF488_01305 [Patescibacteria group bacterium]|jgi:hypothetical protein|nr:hypothetical protein [Patescibacteria group bacterium]